ncbi:MAG: hypothetical protein GX564_07765 [Oligosphaeraceae bacterium]|nr:hypothetical protein [Oligosphaeraceae bacterium]
MHTNLVRPLLLGLLTALSLAAAEMLPQLELWSGREQVLPFPAGQSWKLLSDHGRELAGGAASDQLRITLPPLNPACTETAMLVIDNRETARIRIWPPQILAGLEADFRTADHNVRNALQDNGLQPRSDAKHACAVSIVSSAEAAEAIPGLSLFFAQKRDFPLSVAAVWTDFSCHRAKKPGCLGVLFADTREIIDCRGRLSYIRLYAGKPENGSRIRPQLVIFTPDFDFTAIDNIILLHTLIKEYKP